MIDLDIIIIFLFQKSNPWESSTSELSNIEIRNIIVQKLSIYNPN